jgi:uncharacterized protein (TIGR00251 family)
MTQTIFVTPVLSPSVDPKDWRTALRAIEDHGVSLDIHVEPKASGQAIGPYDPWRQRIKVKVTAPASEGKANEEMSRLLGDMFGIPAGSVRIVRGATTRRKTVLLMDVTMDTVTQILSPVLGKED